MKKKSNNIVEENEQKFQEAMQKWLETKSKASWDTMFLCVLKCCQNICRKRLANKGLSAERINDTALDACCYCMEMIQKKGHKPDKLSSYCYLRCTCYILDKKQQFYDKSINVMSDFSEETEDFLINSIGENNYDEE